MITNMMSPNIKRKCAFSGSKVSAKMEITVHFYMRILKINYLYVNILKRQVSVSKENNAFTDILLLFSMIQMEIYLIKT